jgi:catechol 2,3-dioxygenase-like lactoylglutathione lyase family enzyme
VAVVLGLSHVYGEVEDLDARETFWCASLLRSAFRQVLPVPAAKREQLLVNGSATSVELRYFECRARSGSPGFELLKHTPSGSPAPSFEARSPLAVAIAGPRSEMTRDPDGNRLFLDGRLPARTVVRVPVPDLAAAREIVLALGARAQGDARDRAITLFGDGGDGGSAERFELHLPLFPTLACELWLCEDARAPVVRRVDAGGWQGISLLARDLDAVARRVPLVCAQRVELESLGECELAFFSGAGLLFEFLQVIRGRTPRA